MAESPLHHLYIQKIIENIKDSKANILSSLIIYSDIGAGRKNQPKIPGSSIPDVLAVNIGRSCVIIGEAKTNGDIENEHTQKQLVEYLNYLKRPEILEAELIYAAPWQVLGTLDSLIRRTMRAQSCTHVKYSFVKSLPDYI